MKLPQFFSARTKAHIKGVALALPSAFIGICELRDMHQKSQWDVKPLPPSKYKTGDIVLVCNRWFNLPSWQHKLYGLVCKVIQKSCWDEVGVIIQKGGTPYVLFADYGGARLAPLAEFVDERQPRGIAIKTFEPSTPNGVPALLRNGDRGTLDRGLSIASMLTGQLPSLPDDLYHPPKDLTLHPWRLIAGAWLSNHERKHAVYAVEIALQDAMVKKLRTEKHTHEWMTKAEQRLEDLKIVQEVIRKDIHWGDIESSRCLFNGSLVAEWMVGMGLLPSPVPRTCKYIPADFTEKMAVIDATLSEPRVVYKL